MIDVVIIDDEVWVAKMITQILDWEAYGFRIVKVFHDGVEGLQGIRRLHPQLVLTDIRMPGKSGLEIIREISGEADDILFVIISGYSDFEYAKTALTYGAIGYLLKPIDQGELEKVVLKARHQIAAEQVKKQSELRLKDSMGQTIEKLREQFFINCFEGLGDKNARLEDVNADLMLNFAPGCFQAVSIEIERRERMKECLELVTKAIWEVDLPTDCVEMVTLALGKSLALVLNFSPEQSGQIQQGLERLMKNILDKRPPCGITAGVGTVEEGIGGLPASYLAAREMAMIRLIHGQNRLYSALRQPRSALDESRALCLGRDIELKRAFVSGDLDAVGKLTGELLNQFQMKAQKDPPLLMRGLNCLLGLYQESAPADLRDWREYFSQQRRAVGSVSSVNEAKALLAAAAAEIVGSRESGDCQSGKTAVQEVLRYIEHNYMQDISLGEVSALVHLNPNYFCEIFKKEAGVNFKEYLMAKRMDRAKELLKSPGCKLSEVAAMVGYNDAKHFGKTFKKLVGLTPLAYRKLMIGHG